MHTKPKLGASRINREQFIGDLEMVKAGLSAREFVEQSSCFCFQDGMVLTFNDEVACRKATALRTTGAVQAAALTDILQRLTEDELSVMENEKGELEFRGKRKAFGVVKDAEVFLPIDRVEVPEKWKRLPPEFAEACTLVAHCVSSDENRFLLTCVHITPDYVEACDNMQAMRVKVQTRIKQSVLVRGTSLEQISRLGMNKVSLTSSWVHFKNDEGLIYSCRRYAEDYPPLDEILVVKGHAIVIPKGLKEASERAAVFASDQSGEPQMAVLLRDGQLALKGEGYSGWYKEIKKVAYHGPPMQFLISPELLREISEKYADASISRDKLKITGGNWQYVTVLGRKEKRKKEQEEKE